MAIEEKTPGIMVLHDMWNYITTIAFGLVFVAVGIFAAIIGQASDAWPVLLFCAVFALAGSWVVVSAKKTEVKISKSSGQITLSRFSLLGSKAESYPLENIAKMRLRQRWQSSGKSSHIVHDLEFALKDNYVLTATNVVSDRPSAEKVANFVGMPFEFEALPTIMEAMNAAINKAAQMAQENIDKKNEEKKL